MMALIKCPECKKKISDQCGRCPNCGYPIKTSIENTNSETTSDKATIAVAIKKNPIYKRAWFWIVIGSVLVAFVLGAVLLSSLSNQKLTPKLDEAGNPLFVELTNEVYTNAEQYLGYYVNIKGKVFQVMSNDGNMKGIQVWLDPDTCEQNLMIYYNTAAEVKQGDYIICSGYIGSVHEYKNAYNATMCAPLVYSSDLKKATYIEAVAPATETIIPQQLINEKLGYSIQIDKIEFSAKETRVYITVKNSGNASLYVGNTVIVQNGNQFNSHTNYEANYKEIPYPIIKGVSASGIIVFPAISINDFELSFDVHSDGIDEDIDEFVFKISKTGSFVAYPENEPLKPPTTEPPATEPPTPPPPSQAEKPKDRKQEAVTAAINVADYYYPTHEGFVREVLLDPSLEDGFEPFTESEVDYAMNNAGIDWNEHALGCFNQLLWDHDRLNLIDLDSFSPAELSAWFEELIWEGYSDTEIDYVRQYYTENCPFDWNANALTAANRYIQENADVYGLTPNSIKEFALYGFTDSQTQYAMDNCDIDWSIEVIERVDVLDLNLDHWKPDEYWGRVVQKEDMIKELKLDGFPDEQVNYAIDNCGIDWESRKNEG